MPRRISGMGIWVGLSFQGCFQLQIAFKDTIGLRVVGGGA